MPVYELIALVFLVASPDQLAFPPMHYNRAHFATEEACVNFFDTDEGAAARKRLTDFVDTHLHEPYSITIKCGVFEDNTI